MTRYFRDFYGCTASITQTNASDRPFLLHVSSSNGHRFCSRGYETYKAARCAMGRMGDCWKEVSA